MNTAPPSMTIARASQLRPILAGGALAGTFDMIAAFVTFGPGVPVAIAGGLLGRSAFHGSAGMWILGFLLHYFIAFSAAAVYCLSSRRLVFLKTNWLVCGLFYGIAVFLVMNLVVLPLCALHAM